MSMFSTESLLTSTGAGFGIETLSPLQRAKARLFDGVPLGDLADRDDVRTMLGCEPRFLPTGIITEIFDICGIRTLKTITAAAKCVQWSRTVDVSGVRLGETPRIFWVAAKMEAARAGFEVLVSTMLARPALRRLIIGEPTRDSLTLRHPSGQPIEIVIVPADRAGTSLVGKWCGGAVFEEATRQASIEEGYLANLEDCRVAIRGRLLPGAQIIYPGSPWGTDGLVFRMFTERFGKPDNGVLVLKATAPALNPMWWTPARCAEIQEASPRTYSMDVLAEFGSTSTNAYSLADVEASAKPRTLGRYFLSPRVLSCDPSKLIGESPDRWALSVIGWNRPAETRVQRMRYHQGTNPPIAICPERDSYGREIFDAVDARPFLRVDYCESWQGRGTTLAEIETRIKAICVEHHIQLAVLDYGGDTASLIGLFRSIGVRCEAFPWSPAQRSAGFEWVGRVLADRLIEIPDAQMRRDLMQIHSVLCTNGTSTYQARRNAEGHADLASTLVGYAIAENEGVLHDSPVKSRGGTGRHVVGGR